MADPAGFVEGNSLPARGGQIPLSRCRDLAGRGINQFPINFPQVQSSALRNLSTVVIGQAVPVSR